MKNTKQTVLIVDRHSENAAYLLNFIPLLGPFQVKHAPNLIHAMADTNAYEPKLIIFDLDMEPASQAKRVLDEIRRRHPQSTTLVLISKAAQEAALHQEGFEHVLKKPFEYSTLSTHVKSLLPISEEVGPQREFARLLIADDEPEINLYLEETFKELGIEVRTARDGREAYDAFKQDSPNLAILDLRMPHMSGDELIKKFKESTNPPPPKGIIILTAALGSNLYEIECLGYPVVKKPMNVDILKKMILDECEKFDLTVRK